MMRLESHPKHWALSGAGPWQLSFTCSARISVGDGKACSSELTWTNELSGPERAMFQCHWEGVVQEVEIRLCHENASALIDHRIVNNTSQTAFCDSIRTVDGILELQTPPNGVSYIHSLNARHDLSPLCSLEPNKPSLLLGRVPYHFFEGLAVCEEIGLPAVVTGPLTQNIVHRTQQLTWDGGTQIRLQTGQDLRGIERRAIAPGETLNLDGVFVQMRADGDPNTLFQDYLAALREANGTRWDRNILRKEFFFDPWNNYLYWEATEADLLRAAQAVKKSFPTVKWMGIDDGYQISTANPSLNRLPNGELDYCHATEAVWWRHCPGISFAFPGSLGEDTTKLPNGLIGLAENIRLSGLRPKMWLGMEVSCHAPIAQKHPEWFLSCKNDTHLFFDVSIPEVRHRIEEAFGTYYGAHGFHALKLDFWSRLFESPDLRFRNPEKTAAEWRRWFFEMVRSCLPDDGFLTLGCDIAAGAPFLAPWADSYRHSMDMRDGNWETVKSNVRWSLVPMLTHGFGQPIADADTLSIYKRLTRTELECWADFAYVSGSLVELGGNPALWDEKDIAWLRDYLDHPCAGERVWLGDSDCWNNGGLPRMIYRRHENPEEGMFLVSLHNWNDEPLAIGPSTWVGPIVECNSYMDRRSSKKGTLSGETTFVLPPRSSMLLSAWKD